MYAYSPLLQSIHEHSKTIPEKIAVISGDKSISYQQLWNNVTKMANVLTMSGISKGSRVILSAHKDVEFIYSYLAFHLIGAVSVIIDAESNSDRVRYIEDTIQPDCCLGYKSEKFPSYLFSELNFADAEPYEEAIRRSDLTPESISEILFTTGTTGNPKGVCLSYSNIYSSASNINEFIQNTPEDIELLALPICHSFGLGRIRCNLLKGATIVLLGNFANVRLFLKSIEKYNITGFGVVPAAWAYIRKISGRRIEKYSSQIRYIEIGSASMPIEAKKEMLEIFPNTRICMHYGLTEASRSTFIEFHDIKHLDSIGKPVCDKVDVKIINGEICVKGNMVMSHYLNDQDSEHAFHGEYFRTGDCGSISDDGYIYLLGREKELINVGGKKVSPMEVEDAICAVGVGDCICVPVKDSNGIMGELVKCYILKGSTELTFDEIAERVSEKLELYKRPKFYDWIDSIPVTSSGKKQRVNLH